MSKISVDTTAQNPIKNNIDIHNINIAYSDNVASV